MVFEFDAIARLPDDTTLTDLKLTPWSMVWIIPLPLVLEYKAKTVPSFAKSGDTAICTSHF